MSSQDACPVASGSKGTTADCTVRHSNTSTSSKNNDTSIDKGNFSHVEIYEAPLAGRGLRASTALAAGQLLFVAPTIRVPAQQYKQHCQFTVFEDYLFVGRSGDLHLALSYGSIFNHESQPNVTWSLDEKRDEITYKVFMAVQAGTPLSISYGAWGKQFEEKELPHVPLPQVPIPQGQAHDSDSSSGGENDMLYS